MSYLFHVNKNFTLIDSTAKTGLFCQFFSGNSSPRTMILQSPHTMHYSACLDLHDKPLIVTMPDAYHIHSLSFNGTHVNRSSIVSSTTTNYKLAYPIIHVLEHTPQLIYLSHPNETTTYSFVQQSINASTLTTLMTIEQEPLLLKHFSTNDALYIFYLTKETRYILNCLKISSKGIEPMIYLSSETPIVDYSICLVQDLVHIAYVTELHGKYQLLYLNNLHKQPVYVVTTLTPSAPTIFCYYHALWINALIDKKLHSFLSVDTGIHFSLPVPCSIQNHLHRYQFYTNQEGTLAASELYASLCATLKLCILSTIDFECFHSDSYTPPELSLLLEGLLLANNNNSDISSLLTKNQQLQQELDALKVKQTNSSVTIPENRPSKRSISSAKHAFMEELTGWDLPPRL